MKFYSSIAQNYDYIFPIKQVQIDFVKSVCPPPPTKLIEIGSGTGNLTMDLVNTGYLMTGLEYDLLNNDGIIAIQIINYSRIFGKKIDHFSTIQEFSDFSKNEFTSDSIPFIITGQKE